MFYKNRIINSSILVFVYFNLRKKAFSVKALEGEHKGKVVMHSPSLKMENISFKISEAGRQRVIKEKQKNVHAGVVGYLTDHTQACDVEATYNPYKYSSFVEKSNENPIFIADVAILSNKKVFIRYNEDSLAI